jgi:putative FmdB family regulatory protein
MPLFDFFCSGCDSKSSDVLLKMSHTKADYPVCDKCHVPMAKLVSRANAAFRGSGFHATDYRAPTRGY